MGTFDTATPKRLQLAAWEQTQRTTNVAATGSAAPATYAPIVPPSPVFTHIGHAAQYGRGRRNGRTVRMLVLHVTDVDGSMLGAMSYDARRPEMVSAHAFAGPLGELGAQVPDADRAFTTGRWNDEADELEIVGHDEWTAAQWRARPAQMEAIVRWLVDRCQRWDIPPRWMDRGTIAKGASRHGQTPVQGTERGICDHLEANLAARDLGATSGTGHVCVGPGLRTVLFDDLIPEVARRLSPTTPPQEAPEMSVLDDPVRLIDTRPLGAVVAPEQRLAIPTAPGRPAWARAAVVNIVATQCAGPGFLTAWRGGPRPATSNVNYERAGQTVENLAMVPIGTDGTITVSPSVAGCHLIIDQQGWAA